MASIGNLQRISRERLAAIITDPSASSASSLAIVDVRDDDHVGGHISQSIWAPSSTLDYKIPELVRTLKDKETVIFHCSLSQQRGPSAALNYQRERSRLIGSAASQKKSDPQNSKDESADKPKDEQTETSDSKELEAKEQQVYVLDGGFVKWQEKYGSDERLTTGWVKDIWE